MAGSGVELTFSEFETSYVQGTIKKDTVILRDSAITAVEVQPEVVISGLEVATSSFL